MRNLKEDEDEDAVHDDLNHPGGRRCLRSISLHEGSSSEGHEELIGVGLQGGAGGGGDCHLGGELVSV